MDIDILEEFASYLKVKKEEGKKVIAFMAHDNIPEELFDAAGCIPLRMIFAGNDELMNASHDYLPPSTCSFAQSCIGLFSLKPEGYRFLDLVDYFVVSNHCVSDTCASEIIAKYLFIPRLNFYSSYIQTDTGLKYYKLELFELKKELERIKGSKISDIDLINSIKKYNSFKKLLLEISRLNINGAKKLKIFQEAILYGPDHSSKLEGYLEQYGGNELQKANNSKNILLTGCSIFMGDYLIDLIEESGGNIVHFDSWIGTGYFSQIFEENDLKNIKDPLDLLVKRFKDNIYGDHTVPNFIENKISYLVDIIQTYQSKTGKKLAVVNHIIKFCDHISISQSILKDTLQEKGIPVLNLERDYGRANRGQLSTRIEAFLEMFEK